jgi:hypothetical protein
MEKFLLIIREDIQQLHNAPGLHTKRITEMTKWVAGLAESGNYTGGDALKTTGKYVNKYTVMSDGPFIEAKECISGFIYIDAENLEQAASIAQTCPYVADGTTAIEVRAILETDKSILHG